MNEFDIKKTTQHFQYSKSKGVGFISKKNEYVLYMYMYNGLIYKYILLRYTKKKDPWQHVDSYIMLQHHIYMYNNLYITYLYLNDILRV